MSTNNIAKTSLLAAVSAVKPALAVQSFLPILTTCQITGKWLTAYNDTMAIRVRTPKDLDVSGCVPGDLLQRALTSFKGDTFSIQELDGKHWVLSCGRSKLKVPVFPLGDYPFEMPTRGWSEVGDIEDLLKGMSRCLAAVGRDPTHPAQMGVTLEMEGGHSVLYSTDNFTISRQDCGVSELELPGDSPVILPTAFAEQVIALSKLFPKESVTLSVSAGALLCSFGDAAQLFCKALVDVEPMSFADVLARHVKVAAVGKMVEEVPEGMEDAVERALLVVGGEIDKVMKVSARGDTVKITATSASGESEDSLALEGASDMLGEPAHIDPVLLLRGLKSSDHIVFRDRCAVLTGDGGNYLHMIAYCSAS